VPLRSRSRCARCNARWCAPTRSGALACTGSAKARSAASGSRASSARSPIARPRSGKSASAGEFQHRFEVESYLEHVSNGFADIFDANAFMQLSRAMDLFDLAEHGEGSLARACARMKLQGAMVIGVESDILFPVNQQREVAYALRDAGVPVEFHALASLQGHDAFLADLPRFGATIGDYFNLL
jgi:homoserine acetyltransferase